MRSRSIRTTTIAVPAVLLALAGCGTGANGAPPGTAAEFTGTTIALSTYVGAAGVAGAAAGNYRPAFDGSEYAGAAGVVGAAAGTYRFVEYSP